MPCTMWSGCPFLPHKKSAIPLPSFVPTRRHDLPLRYRHSLWLVELHAYGTSRMGARSKPYDIEKKFRIRV